MPENNLSQKKCVPCEGGASPLTREEAQAYLEQVSGWQLNETATAITKTFTRAGFDDALSAVNQIGEIARAEDHHPDICLHDYKKLTVTTATHAIDGLSENDFIIAAKIDARLDEALSS